MKIQTAITNMLGIDLPVIGAPMFLVSYPELVAAVSNAGGIGCFPALNFRGVEALRDGIQKIRSLTNQPVGANIILHKEHNPHWPEQLKICLDEKIELIITSLGIPRTVVGEAHSAGAKVFCDVTTLRHANAVTRAGADALIAVAQGAGGHAGAISPFSLIPYLKKETGLPVVAAGAISGGSQMAASFCLGADAIYMGTRLIASKEAAASDEYKAMILSAKPEEILYTAEISGIPANWLIPSVEKLLVDGKLIQDSMNRRKQWKDIWSAGHGVAQIDSILPAGEIVRKCVEEYLLQIAHLPGKSEQ